MPSALIIGAGFGGVAAAIELQNHGFRQITILEAAPELGGTWFHNSYPGAACDIPSRSTRTSFEQRKDWTRICSLQSDILGYLKSVSAKYGIDPLIHTDSPVADCVWSEEHAQWTATTVDGRPFAADTLIVATGQLNRPRFPAIPGISTFGGHAFHSARWDHTYPLAGKRVAVIGNGASAVQFIPEIADEVHSLDVYQRTGNWFMARTNHPYPRVLRAAIRYVPGFQRARRFFVFHFVEQITRSIRHPKTAGKLLKLRSWLFMRRQLRGAPELRRKVWPSYTFGCKRILFSSHFLPALRRPNVDLITEPIREITASGVVTADGTHREVDCLIHATGFHATDFMLPMAITGTGGTSLQDTWTGGAHAHLGMTVPGFPSMFLMYGPNTNTSGGSILVYLEAQAAYIRQAMELMRDSGATAVEVRPEVEAASDAQLQSRFAGTAWLGCDSWYRADGGRIVANWPGYMHEYLAWTQSIDPTDFRLTYEATTAGSRSHEMSSPCSTT